MTVRFSLLSLSRRRLLITASAVAVAGLVAVGLTPAQSAGGPQKGGSITFLIDSLGGTWIPNNSAISSFQGHIWGHVTDKLVYVDETARSAPGSPSAGSRTTTPPNSPCTSRTA